MSDNIIKVLPESVVNQIAAGEVIQTPSSVVKELLENAIDAGASKVEVLLKDSGRTFIKVIDNGKGMSVEDAKVAFTPHATSKLKSAEDLFRISTMGFRGEALSTIAAVSQVSMITRRSQDELSFRLDIEASKITNEEPGLAPTGTSFIVRNLFYNIPARRKFLGDNSKLLRDIKNAFIRVVLVYPEIEFILKNNDKEIFVLPPDNMKKRILAIYANRNSGKLYKDLLPVNVDTKIIKISGFVGTPDIAAHRDILQFFFVNGRYIIHKYLRNAIYKAFETLLPAGKQPTFFLYLEVDPSTLDVNIHPTKTEVKFENELALWPILNAAVREVLAKFDVVPSISFDDTQAMDIRVFTGERDVKKPEVNYSKDYNPFKENIGGDSSCVYDFVIPSKHNDVLEKKSAGYEKPFTPFGGLDPLDSPIGDEFSFGADIENRSLFKDNSISEKKPSFFKKDLNKVQLLASFILLYNNHDLFLFDQHCSSVCVLYERFLRQLKNHKSHSQTLLYPEELVLDDLQRADLDLNLNILGEFGFVIEKQDGKYTILAVPQDSNRVSPTSLVLDLIAEVGQSGLPRNNVSDFMARSLAKRFAVPYGKLLTTVEMNHLIKELSACENFNYTPSGKRVFKRVSMEDIKKIF